MVTFRKLTDTKEDYLKLHRWCSNKNVYEWFEQRILSLDEIESKYKNKLLSNKQELYIINYDDKDIGFVQIYKYENDIDLKYDNAYEYDIFIGEEEYLNKGIGKDIVNSINNMIFKNTDTIILRPFKRNEKAIKCYQKCGFKLIKEYDGIDTLGNKEIISVLVRSKDGNN